MDSIEVCHAISKRSGKRCLNYAIKGKGVCSIHGGKSSGPKTKIGKIKQRMANFKHGMYTSEAIAERRVFTVVIKQYREDLLDL